MDPRHAGCTYASDTGKLLEDILVSTGGSGRQGAFESHVLRKSLEYPIWGPQVNGPGNPIWQLPTGIGSDH